jgi:hypothetical protein
MERAMKTQEGCNNLNLNLPLPKPNNTFKWNSEGTALENYDIIGENNSFKQNLLNDISEQERQMSETINNNKTETDTQISNISKSVDSANTVANSAIKTADNALSISNIALDKSNTAVATANSAETKADNAISTANTALTTSESAVVTSNEAKEIAESARTTAEGIADTANSALQVASEAVNNVQIAIEASEEAQKASDNVVSTAQYAKDTADSALSKIDTTLEQANTALDNTNKLAEQVEEIPNKISNLQENKADKATTLSGYGITNAYTKTETDNFISTKADTSSLSTVATTGKYSDLTGTPTIDTALSSSSANAVQNKVVTTALNTKRTNLYARCAMGRASSSYPYVQLANYYDATTSNNNITALFIVDVTGETIAKSGSGIVRLWGRWSTSSVSALNFELLSYNGGDNAKALIQNLVACYSYTANNSTGFKLEIWEKTTTSYQTLYLRPISMCSNDYGKSDIINGFRWNFNSTYGDATSVGSASITSGYTQVAMTDKTTASYVTEKYSNTAHQAIDYGLITIANNGVF